MESIEINNIRVYARHGVGEQERTGDPGFLAEKKLTLEHTRYTVMLEHADFRLRAYFEDAQINVTAADKRSATTITAAPTKQQSVDSVEQALDVLAQYLADETI